MLGFDFNSTGLAIPELCDDVDVLTAALAYANAGWYVLPVGAGTKNPGSVVGRGWQAQSSRDPKVLAAWFAASDYGIALHVGRSGAVVFDVDKPAEVPEVMRPHLQGAPYQSTRPDQEHRGHYMFAVPAGRTFGNGTGKLGGAWGEVRGTNGVIVVAPTPHSQGGKYRWLTTGVVPVLPAELAELLPSATPSADAASDMVVNDFLADHVGADRPELLAAVVNKLRADIAEGKSRHDSTVKALTWAMREAAAGLYPATVAAEQVWAVFKAAVLQDGSRTQAVARSECRGMLSWAVAQALIANLDEVRRGASERMPRDAFSFDPAHLGIDVGRDAMDSDDSEHTPFAFQRGGAFIFDRAEVPRALWGCGNEILWAEGESLMIAGNMGLGKTTLEGLLIRAQLRLTGCGDGTLLGLHVAPAQGRVLALLMDRPHQAARALARQFDQADRDVLDDRLLVWAAPPPADLARRPELLLALARDADADVVYLDSVKDAAIGLSEDAVGAGYSRARSLLLADGRQLCELHHTIKRGANGGPPTQAADIYGSAWITNGTGSILLLAGEPGDPIVECRHVRQPVEEVGPLTLLHDHGAGTVQIYHQADLAELAKAMGENGLTAKDAAAALFCRDGETPPSRAQIEKARRKLDRLASLGVLTEVAGAVGGRTKSPSVWFPANGAVAL
ncbi:bifunctional DNA primase/polymerase [Mycolicibacterium novocastrense]|nr:bifunctional DNA primase/polymerase [Mycolicibacterium novocastrense]